MDRSLEVKMLTNQEELQSAITEFLSGWKSEGQEKRRFEYQGVQFRLKKFGMPGLLGAILLGWFYGIVNRIFKVRRGLSLVIDLPKALNFDLWMESKWQKEEKTFGLEGSFWIQSPQKTEFIDAVRPYKGLIQRFEQLDAVSRLVLTDEKLMFGPLPPREDPKRIAELAIRAIELARGLSDLPEEQHEAEQVDDQIGILEPTGGERVVYRSSDPMEAEFIIAQLRKYGLEAEVVGTRIASLLGAGPHIFRLKIIVAASQLEAANRILELIFSDSTFHSRPWIDDLDAVVFQKKRSVAFGTTFILPGGAHFYVMRPVTGLFIGLLVLASLVLALITKAEKVVAVSLVVFATSVLTDLVGSQIAFGAMKRKQFRSVVRQVVNGLLAIIIALGIAYGLVSVLNLSLTDANEIWLPIPTLFEIF